MRVRSANVAVRWITVGALVLACGMTAASAQTAVAGPVLHATGLFDVAITPIAAAPDAPTSTTGLVKTFSGGIVGVARGTMIGAGDPKPGSAAAYVAIDVFDGTVDGRRGGFLLTHRGSMTKAGETTLDVTIVPDSGTGALQGIAGSLAIVIQDGKHLYDLAYTLPR